MSIFEEVRSLVADVLQLGDRASSMTVDTQLLGAIPELDSMAVVAVITAIEEAYGFAVNDDEITADTFFSLGSLVSFVESKTEG
jgi:acyl carrier protein